MLPLRLTSASEAPTLRLSSSRNGLPSKMPALMAPTTAAPCRTGSIASTCTPPLVSREARVLLPLRASSTPQSVARVLVRPAGVGG